MTLAVFQTTVQTDAGDVIPNATVTVRNQANQLVSLFSNAAGTTSLTNPFNATVNGFARCYAAAGRYNITITGGGNTVVLNDVLFHGTAAVANIVGTVSQSGGVPTGDIIQRGSNANGEFVRFADGTMMGWSFRPKELYVAASTLFSNAQGLQFYRSNTDTWSPPAAFVGSPSLHMTVSNGTSGTRTMIPRSGGFVGGVFTNNQVIGFEGWRSTEADYINLVGVFMLAIGRWY